jgi:hypothetical protein
MNAKRFDAIGQMHGEKVWLGEKKFFLTQPFFCFMYLRQKRQTYFMKQFFFASLLAGMASVALLSCSKQGDRHEGTKYVTIDTTLASGTLYQLDLKPYGDADDIANIKTQATDYTTSEIVNTGSGFSPLYRFSATTDAKTGLLTEQVVIAITEGNNGRPHPHNDSTLVTINFKVQ